MKKELLVTFFLIIAGLLMNNLNAQENQLCTPNWTCTDWSPCMDNIQVRSCADTALCNTNFEKPDENQVCGKICQPNWQCDEWKPKKCDETRTQNRECIDTSFCNVSSGKPEEVKTCLYIPNFTWVVLFIIIAIVILIVGMMGIIKQRLKNKISKLYNQ